jgi:FkbM family methyltransferase
MNIDLNNLGSYNIPSETKGGVCIDIGANTGAFTLKYANHFSKIHYYEPIKELFNLINDRLKDYPHVTGFNEAVFNESDKCVSIYLHSNKDSGSSAIKSDVMDSNYKNDWTDNILEKDITTVSLEKIFDRINGVDIDYMKIDCETSEYLFLINKDLSKIKHLGIEIHCQLGKNKWDELVNHILKYFNNVLNYNLKYTPNFNKELYFSNKSLN